jgi:hypothetical protein
VVSQRPAQWVSQRPPRPSRPAPEQAEFPQTVDTLIMTRFIGLKEGHCFASRRRGAEPADPIAVNHHQVSR